MLEFSRDRLDEWTGRPLEEGTVDVILAAEGARATKTFRGGLLLCEAGFGQQAQMLARGLFEGMVVAHWTIEHEEEALDLFEKHALHVRVLWGGKLDALGWLPDDKPPPSLSPEDRALFGFLFGTYGERHWTGLSMHRLVEAVAHQWSDDGAELREFYGVAHHESNLLLHSTTWALERTLIGREGENVRFESGPSGAYVGQALYGLFWNYLQLLSLIMDRFEMPDREALTQLGEDGVRAFRQLSDDVLKSTGRNDPCPCGSGKKFKNCHGKS